MEVDSTHAVSYGLATLVAMVFVLSGAWSKWKPSLVQRIKTLTACVIRSSSSSSRSSSSSSSSSSGSGRGGGGGGGEIGFVSSDLVLANQSM